MAKSAKSQPAALPLKATWPQRDIPLADLRSDDKNHRLKTKQAEAQFRELVESMRIDGQLQPVLVYEDVSRTGFFLVFGSRRVAAARELGNATISALVMDYTPAEGEIQRLRAVENLKRGDLTPAEQCVAIAMLVEANRGNVQEAARDLGLDPKLVQDRWYVHERLTPKVRDMLGSGRINFDQARELAKVGDAGDQFSIADAIDIVKHARVHSAQEVKGMVENRKHSLKVVPWKLEEAFAGKPACAGCKDNTATDVTLFDTSKDEAEKGCCLNDGCFEHKQKKSLEAQEKTLATIKLHVKEKRIDKGDAAGVNVVTNSAPAFLKISSVQRKVAQVYKPAEKSGAKAAAEKPVSAVQKKTDAKNKWSNAVDAWRDKIRDAVRESDVSGTRIVHLLLDRSKLVQANPQWWSHSDKEEKPISPKLAALLEQAARLRELPIHSEMAALVDDLRDYDRYDEGIFDGAGPELCVRLANVFRIDAPPCPKLEDFLPADLKPKTEKPVICEISSNAAPAFKPGDVARWVPNGQLVKIGNATRTTVGKDLRIQILFAQGGSGWAAPGELAKPTLIEAMGFDEAWKKSKGGKGKRATPAKKAKALVPAGVDDSGEGGNDFDGPSIIEADDADE